MRKNILLEDFLRNFFFKDYSNKMLTTRKFFFFFFLNSLIPFKTIAQHEQLLDSLQHLTSYERRRVVFGYSESAADVLNIKKQRIYFFEQIRKFAIQKNDKDLLQQLQFMKRKQSEVMDFPRAEREKKCKECIEKYTNSDDLLFLAFCHHELGQILFQNQNYAQAFDNDLRALEIYSKTGYENVPNIGKVLHELALHYYFFRDYEEVIRLMKISLRFPPFSDGLDIQRYNNLGMSYMQMNMTDSSSYFLNKAMIVASKYKSEIWMGLLSGNIGELYYNEGKFDSSLVYFRKNFEYNKDEEKHTALKVNSYVNMAKTYLALDSISKANDFLKMTENTLFILETNPSYVGSKYVGDRQQIENSKRQYFEVKINYLKKIGDFRTAVQYQDSLMKIRKEIEEKYNSTIGKMAFDRLTIQNKELLLTQKEQEKTDQRLFYTNLISIVCLLGSLGYFYMYRSRHRKKQQNERLVAENKIAVLEKQQVHKELENAQKEINHFVSKIHTQNDIISGFEEDLKKLQGLKENEHNQVSETLKKMKTIKILTDEDWIEFQNNFDTVFSDFRGLIKSEFPLITSSEMRYLMLSKLNFSHKEMARTLGISDAAIRLTLSRVRKRLNRTSRDTPADIIERIIQENLITKQN